MEKMKSLFAILIITLVFGTVFIPSLGSGCAILQGYILKRYEKSQFDTITILKEQGSVLFDFKTRMLYAVGNDDSCFNAEFLTQDYPRNHYCITLGNYKDNLDSLFSTSPLYKLKGSDKYLFEPVYFKGTVQEIHYPIVKDSSFMDGGYIVGRYPREIVVNDFSKGCVTEYRVLSLSELRIKPLCGMIMYHRPKNLAEKIYDGVTTTKHENIPFNIYDVNNDSGDTVGTYTVVTGLTLHCQDSIEKYHYNAKTKLWSKRFEPFDTKVGIFKIIKKSADISTTFYFLIHNERYWLYKNNDKSLKKTINKIMKAHKISKYDRTRFINIVNIKK